MPAPCNSRAGCSRSADCGAVRGLEPRGRGREVGRGIHCSLLWSGADAGGNFSLSGPFFAAGAPFLMPPKGFPPPAKSSAGPDRSDPRRASACTAAGTDPPQHLAFSHRWGGRACTGRGLPRRPRERQRAVLVQQCLAAMRARRRITVGVAAPGPWAPSPPRERQRAVFVPAAPRRCGQGAVPQGGCARRCRSNRPPRLLRR